MTAQQPNRAFMPGPMNRRWKEVTGRVAATPSAVVTATVTARETADAFAANEEIEELETRDGQDEKF